MGSGMGSVKRQHMALPIKEKKKGWWAFSQSVCMSPLTPFNLDMQVVKPTIDLTDGMAY